MRKKNAICRALLPPLVVVPLFLLIGSLGFPSSVEATFTIRRCYCHNICPQAGGGGDQCTSNIGLQQGHQKSVNCHNCLVAVEASCNDQAPNYDSCFEGATPPCENSVEDTFGKCNGCGNGIIENEPGCCDPTLEVCNDPNNLCEKCDDGNNQNWDGCNENCQKECIGGCCDGNPCTTDSCDFSTGLCRYVPNPGAACDDDNLCTTDDLCQEDATCSGIPEECTALDQCHGVGTCDPGTGICSDPLKPDGSACSDDSVCTDQDQCLAGICIPGPPISCDDANPCTDDPVCDSQSGCVHTNLPDETSCSDENFCNGDEVCQNGVCTAGVPPSCDDGNPCTEDSCDLGTNDCLHSPIDTGQTTCGVGACERTVDNCIDGQPQTCIPGEPSEEICDGIDNDCDGVIDGPDTDGDGETDLCELCDEDPNKTEPGICGCGIADTDSDGDETADCNDQCPNDPNKTEPGICGCGVSDIDSDQDGTADCNDQCPNDPAKTSLGICGCGVADIDSDGDETADCNDRCPENSGKVEPGVCGCSLPDLDTDGDGTPDCIDPCPSDPAKTDPGICGCGVPDADSDGDGMADCNEECPADSGKTVAGACGCSVPDTDTDGDGSADCLDQCPNDPGETAPGVCGCGIPETDTEGDGIPDCQDNCVAAPNLDQTDLDADGVGDACDNCVIAPNPSQDDADGNGIGDACEPAPQIAPPLLGDVGGGRACTLVRGTSGHSASAFPIVVLLLSLMGLSFFRRTRHGVLLIVVASVGMLLAKPAATLETQTLRPNSGHTRGFQVFTSETLPRYHLTAGLNVNYAHDPLEVFIPGTTSRLAGLVDNFVTADLLLSYGILDRWTVSVDMPVNLFHDIAPTFIATRDRGGGDAGDLSISSKIQVFDAEKTALHLGLAVVPFITIPTGRESIYFGDSSVTGGALVVGDTQIKSNRIYVNVGARFRQREQIQNLIVNEELLYGVGFQRPLVKKWDLDVIAELFGATNFRKFVVEDISSPAEALLVFRKRWGENRAWVAQLGGGMGLTNGYGLPRYRVTAGLAYAWDLKKEMPTGEVIRTSDIHFEFDRSKILANSHPILDSIVATIKSRPEIEGVRIEGHTDNHGTDAYNDSLSAGRAAAVLEYLTSHGVSRNLLTSVGKGERAPIAPNEINGRDNPAGRAENRRVEFHLSIRPGAKVKVIEGNGSPTYPAVGQ